MSESRHAARSLTIAISGDLIGMAFVLAQGIITARYLGAELFGVWRFSLAWVLTASAAIDLGLSTMATREIARDHSCAGSLLSHITGLRMTLGLATGAALALIGFHTAPSHSAGILLCIMCLYLLLSAPNIYLLVFRATERMLTATIINVGSRALALLGLVCAIRLHGGLIGVALAFFAALIATILLIALLLPPVARPLRIRIQPSRWKPLVIAALPFFAMNMLWEIYSRIDQMLIPYLDSMRGNGLYGIAVSITMNFQIIPTAISGFVYPWFTRRAANAATPPMHTASRILYRYLSIISFGSLVLVGLFGEDWIVLLFGNEYREAAGALLILTATLPLIALYAVNVPLLYALDRQGVVLKILLAGVAIDVILDLLLIPPMGYRGAAWATLATHAVFCTGTIVEAHRAVPGLDAWKHVARPAASAAGAAAVILAAAPLDFAPRLAAGAASYAILLLITRALTPQDAALFRDALRRGGSGISPP
jgi:O-antigen/teichoic acid export membrane protein